MQLAMLFALFAPYQNDSFTNSLVINVADVNAISSALFMSLTIGHMLVLNCSESFLGGAVGLMSQSGSAGFEIILFSSFLQ